MLGSGMIFSDDDVSFGGVDRFEEVERERSFPKSENEERILMTRDARVLAFFKRGA